MGIAPKETMGIALAVIFIAALVPVALDLFFSANTTGWDAGSIALWAIIPIAIIALVILRFMPSGGKGA